MPIRVQLPDGNIAEFPDGMPPEEIEAVLQRQFPSQQAAPQASLAGLRDLSATIGSSMLADPLAGLAGLAGPLGAMQAESSLSPGFEALDAGRATETIRTVQDALTVELSDEAIDTVLAGVNELPEGLVNTVSSAAQRFNALADAAGEVDPILGAGVKTFPIAVMELAGFKGTRGLLRISGSRALAKTLKESAPSTELLRRGTRALYREIADSGAVIDPNQMRLLRLQLRKAAKEGAGDADLAPKASQALSRLEARLDAGEAYTAEDLINLRKVARNLTESSSDAFDLKAGQALVDSIDGFIDDLNPSKFVGGQGVRDMGPKLRLARELHRRRRRSEALTDAIDNGRLAASGMENGIRQEFRRLIKANKKRRYFTTDEIQTMQQVVDGTGSANLFKKLSKLGMGQGQQTNVTTGLLATALGFQVGGPAGALFVGGLGWMSGKLARRLTAGSADAADQILRAGSDARAIIRGYKALVPASQRNAQDLAALLVRPDVDLDTAVRLATDGARGAGVRVNLQPMDVMALDRARRARERVAALVGSAVSGAATGQLVGAAPQGQQEPQPIGQPLR